MVGAVTSWTSPDAQSTCNAPAHRYIPRPRRHRADWAAVDTGWRRGRFGRPGGWWTQAGRSFRTPPTSSCGGRQRTAEPCGLIVDAGLPGGWHLRRWGRQRLSRPRPRHRRDVAPWPSSGLDELLTARDTSERPTDLSPATRPTWWRHRTPPNARAGYVHRIYTGRRGHAAAGQVRWPSFACSPRHRQDRRGHQGGAHLRPDPAGVWRRRCAVRERGTPGREMRQRLSHEMGWLRRRSGSRQENVVATMNKRLATMCPLPCGWTTTPRPSWPSGERASPRPASLRPTAPRSGWWCWTTCNWRSGAQQEPQRGTDRVCRQGHRDARRAP